MPIRIQRKRTKGWKMPKNTVSVTRPGKYGNPFVVGKEVDRKWFYFFTPTDCYKYFSMDKIINAKDAVYLFEKYALPMILEDRIHFLKGKNLACFCKLDQSCHADVLLQIANQ